MTTSVNDTIARLEDVKWRAQMLWACSPLHFIALMGGVSLHEYIGQIDKLIDLIVQLQKKAEGSL